MDSEVNIFEDEYKNIAGDKQYIDLSEVLKISLLDENNEFKINLAHIPTLYFLDHNKNGKFTIENFSKLSKIYQQKEKVYKRYEFRSQLQAHFTLLMWKEVCSIEGEKLFAEWIKKLLLITQNIGEECASKKKNNSNENINSDESNKDDSYNDEVNPDPHKFISIHTAKLFFEILNVKVTHGLDFQYFFDLMQHVSDNMMLIEGEIHEDFIHITVIEYFCVNFIRGFSKLLVDLGFDNFLLSELQ